MTPLAISPCTKNSLFNLTPPLLTQQNNETDELTFLPITFHIIEIILSLTGAESQLFLWRLEIWPVVRITPDVAFFFQFQVMKLMCYGFKAECCEVCNQIWS